MNESPRETIARWAEYTQNVLDDLSRLLDTHDQMVGQVQGLEERARAAERRAEAAEQRSASVTECATRLSDGLAAMRQQFEDLRRECSWLEPSLPQSHPERQPAPVRSPEPVRPTAATGPRRPPIIRFSALTRGDPEAP